MKNNPNNNGLPEVNEYIKNNKLKPALIELKFGSAYDENHDRTYLLIDNNNIYVSYSNKDEALALTSLRRELVVCKGRIKNDI